MLAFDSSMMVGEVDVRREKTTDYADLMRKVAEDHDKEAFAVLFAHFAPRIKALMMKHSTDAGLAEELMQETMLTVWLKAGQYLKGRGSVGAWMFTIARNKRIDYFRKQGTGHYVDVDEYDFPDEKIGSEEQVLSDERDRLVSAATQKLPEDQRQVVWMSYVQDLPQIEIAKQLGLPLGTVKSRMRLAYQKIKNELEGVL